MSITSRSIEYFVNVLKFEQARIIYVHVDNMRADRMSGVEKNAGNFCWRQFDLRSFCCTFAHLINKFPYFCTLNAQK